MRTIAPLLAITVLASACGSMQPTTMVRDDVYDIPDRTPVVAAASSASGSDDYYDPSDSGQYDLEKFEGRSYNDITYNDPQWYNSTRFGFGVGVSSWGPSYGMGMSYGNPLYGDPFGNPYWNNSYMSGYGAWGYPAYGYPSMGMGFGVGYGYPMYGYPAYGYGYGMGGYPYYGGYYPPYGCGGCYGCGGSYYGNGAVVQHRPSLSGGGMPGTGNTVVTAPSRYRPTSLLARPADPGSQTRNATNSTARPSQDRSRVSGGSNNTRSGGRNQGTRSSGGEMHRSTGSFGGGGSMGGGGGGSRPSTGGGHR